MASKIIDGEAVLIHFTSGTYYSTDQSGAAIVELLDGRTVSDIVEAIGAAYTGDADAISQAVAAFVDRLIAEGLVVPAETPSTSPMPDLAPGPFIAPDLNRYADLQDLLVLDPIHDTDDAGWPVTPEKGDA